MTNYDKLNYIINTDILIYDVFWKNNCIYIISDGQDITIKINNREGVLKQVIHGDWTSVYIYEAAKNIDKISIGISYKDNYIGNVVLTNHKISEENEDNFINASTMFTNDVASYIIEAWIQHNLFLGVNKIFLYYNSCDTHLYNKIDLKKESLFIPWNFPVPHKYLSNKKFVNHRPQQTASMIHCLYKYCKNESIWMMSLDLDELILPINYKTIKESIENISKDIDYIPMKGHSSCAQSNINLLSPAYYNNTVSYETLKKTQILSKFPTNRKYLHKCHKSEIIGIHDRTLPPVYPEKQNYYDNNITFLHLSNFSRFRERIAINPSNLDRNINEDWSKLHDIQ